MSRSLIAEKVEVEGADQAGIRWFELRRTPPGSGNWTLFQEGTHAPDTDNRWVGSIAMDEAGNIALGAGADPRIFALTVAICTSNSFLIPTHQVNALIMGPGGYRVPDFMKAGGIMTILFIIVSVGMLNLIF